MTRGEVETQGDGASPALREGVRAGILAALEQDVQQRGGRTARLLGIAGALGAFGAVGATLLLSGHAYGHHPSWHVVAFTALWAGLLVVSLALAFLGVRTPELSLGRAARVGLVGLGVAGVCGALCPDPHFLDWWLDTRAGEEIAARIGPALSVACFGATGAFAAGAIAAFAAIGARHRAAIRTLAPALALYVLLAPGLVLQAFGAPWSVFSGWILGAAAGTYLGVALGVRARGLLAPA